MRAARQQASELENVGSYLNAAIDPESGPPKEKPDQAERNSSNSRHLNGKLKSIRTDHLARFAEPPAPPPQQPLPEKPDSARSSPINSNPGPGMLRRGETARPSTSNGSSPTNSQSSHMLQLVEALSVAKKELDSQAARVKQLEDMLKEERTAREDAEERARRLEQTSDSRPVSITEEEPVAASGVETANPMEDAPIEPVQLSPPASNEQQLQKKLETMVSDMRKMREDMDKFKKRAETAETDATKARESLAEMIERLRKENSDEAVEVITGDSSTSQATSPIRALSSKHSAGFKGNSEIAANGHIRTPKLPAPLEQAVTTVLRESTDGNGEVLAHSAPYVSMLGVVLIGVGLMAYLNSWQKTER